LQFKVHVLNPANNAKAVLLYDNMTSELVWDNGAPAAKVTPKEYGVAPAVSAAAPGGKTAPKKLKVSLGLSCNYECNYCNQRFVPHADSTNPGDIEPFVAQLTVALTEPPERIEFWGGEPFVYWKILKPLAERLREMYPEAHFNIITNGSLLDAEKIEWLDRLGFAVGISHDGPGYHARGTDPLDDPEKRVAIMDLWARLGPQGRMSVNAMMHAGNRSRAAVQEWLHERFGSELGIGEGSFIDPYDEGGLAATFNTYADHIAYRQQAFKELRLGSAAAFSVAAAKITDFVRSITKARPASALGQKCGMDRADNLAVDLHGNVVTCQNVSAVAIAPNGQPHKIGHLSDLANVQMRSSTHWSHRKDCPNCPVLQLCKGSCMFLEGKLWDAGCDAAYSDNIPFFAAAIEFLTGCIPYYIEGDFREERKDIFGQLKPPSEKVAKRVIPIAPAAL
jgi:uncharacterized protein